MQESDQQQHVPGGRPCVAVILPAAGASCSGLAAAVRSILAQPGVDLELLLAGRMPAGCAEQWPEDPRIHPVAAGEDDAIAARNAAIAAVSESRAYVAFWEAGWTSDVPRLFRQAAYLDDHPKTDVVGSYAAAGAPGAPRITRCHLSHGALAAAMETRCPLPPVTLMFRREALAAAGGLKAEFSPMADYDLLARLAQSGARLAALAQVLMSHPDPQAPGLPERLASGRAMIAVQQANSLRKGAAPPLPRDSSADYLGLLGAVDGGHWTLAYERAGKMTAERAMPNPAHLLENAASDLAELESLEQSSAAGLSVVEADWDEEAYLARNRDVAEAVNSGRAVSGLVHYIKHGRHEGREPGLRTASNP